MFTVQLVNYYLCLIHLTKKSIYKLKKKNLKKHLNFITKLKNKMVDINIYLGMHRAPTFVLGYLISVYGMTLEEAYKLTKNKRSIIDPP